LGSEDPKAYDVMIAQILESLEPRDFIEEMFAKDLTDAIWEAKRYMRHKDLVIERQYLWRKEMKEAQKAKKAHRAEESAKKSEQASEPAKETEKIEPVGQMEQAGAPPTQVERMIELAEVVDTVISDCDEIIASPVDELKYAAALQSNITYYERLERLYSVSMARRDDVLKQLDLYRQGLGRHLRRVSDDIIEGEFSETKQVAPSIIGPGDGEQ
jgi:hypothetical protein